MVLDTHYIHQQRMSIESRGVAVELMLYNNIFSTQTHTHTVSYNFILNH